MESFLTKHKSKSYNKLIQAYDKSTNPDEKKAIQILAQSLYSAITAEGEKALNIYKQLDASLIQHR